MTMPKDFIMNTDYLSLAQVGNTEFTAYFGGETFTGGQTYDRYQNFTVEEMGGAIDRILISMDGTNYSVGEKLYVSTSPAILYFTVSRTSPTNVQVRLHLYTSQPSYQMPTQTLFIKIASFRPPNVY